MKSKNINDRCSNTRCPMRFTCALDLEKNSEFDIEGRCQMGWRAPKKDEPQKPKRRGSKKHKARRKPRAREH